MIDRNDGHTPGTLSAFQAKYSDEQRDAVVAAVIDRGTSAAEVARMAQRGELPGKDGPLEPFTIPASTIRSEARKVRDRRLGRQTSQLAQLPPRDAIEALRRRMVNLADRELRDLERRAAGTVDAERFRQLGRVLREVQAIPGPKDARPAAPGAKVDGKRDGGATRGGMAGALIAAHRGATAQSADNAHTHMDTGDAAQRSAPNDGAAAGTTDDGPGSVARANDAAAPIAA